MSALVSEVGTRTAAAAHNLVKVYGKGDTAVRALDGINVAFEAGRFTAIMGPSGSGKSTLMHCLAGLDTVDSGAIHIGQTEITKLNDKDLTKLRRDRVGFVFQAFNLLPTLTAEQNILLGLELAGRKPDKQWFDTIVNVLGLRDRLTHRPTELSGGQQQRVLDFLRMSVRKLGQTVIMVTHDPVAASYADRVVLLADGRLAGEIHQPTTESVVNALTHLGA
jgi:putative ABC transport system ATP-binding protein